MQKARHYPEGLWQLVSIRFQVLFHSPFGVLFTFPSRYSSLSVIWEYLALPRGRGGFKRNFTCSVLLGRKSSKIINFQIRGFHPLWPDLSWSVLLINNFLTRRKVWYLFKILPATPIKLSYQAWHLIGLGYSQFARRYSGNHYCFLFLQVLRCFTSLRYSLLSYVFR